MHYCDSAEVDQSCEEVAELPKKQKLRQHSFISTHRDAVMDGAEKKRSATLIVPSRRCGAETTPGPTASRRK